MPYSTAMKIAICDDSLPLHKELKNHLDAYAQEHRLIFDYYDFTSGHDLLASTYKFDLIFMDFQMDDLDGIETSRRLRSRKIDVPIVFLTSYANVVFDAFEVNAYRFLVKPVNKEKLEAALNSFIHELDDDNYILIKTEDMNKRININDIIYVEASGKYCYIRDNEMSHLYKGTLAEVEAMLPEDMFFRSHRTYLVGLRHIVSHDSTNILFDNDERAIISKMKLTAFKKAFTDYIKRSGI